MRSLIWASAQSYLGCLFFRTYHTWGTLLLIFAVEHAGFQKSVLFRAGFQSGHYEYHILWTSPYEVIVPTRASTQK